uniref:Putative animal peptidoglycan recognition protein n=1 Tax=Ixodes ricinus TaxID=34613 RepID=V5H5Y1_IXORI
MLTAAGTGRNSEKDMGISAAMLSFVLLVSERIAGEGASAATAAISQRARWQQKCLSRGVTKIYNPEKNRTHPNGLRYPEVEMCGEISFVGRDDWGARPPKAVNSFNIPGGVSYVFYYHTEGNECFCRESCAQITAMWQGVHLDCQGWDDIGYSFIIGGEGTVYEGRGWSQIGAHTVGFNNISVSLAFVGNYTHKVPNESMLQAAREPHWMWNTIEQNQS